VLENYTLLLLRIWRDKFNYS